MSPPPDVESNRVRRAGWEAEPPLARDGFRDRPTRATVYVPQTQVLDALNAMTNYWFASSLLVRTAGSVDLSGEISKIAAVG